MYRNFVFTLNNPLTNGGLELCDWLEKKCTYVIIGCERGTNGTFHWQGYAELRSPCRLTTLCGDGRKWHVEQRRGTQQQAVDYSKKDANYITHGKLREQGRRGDLDRTRSLAHEGGMRAVCMVASLQQIRVAEKYLQYCEEPRDWKPEVIWLIGPSGSGKSRMARKLLGEDVFTKNTGHKWWDGYDGHEDVIIDDFRDSWWPITYMLALLDRYEFQVENKGGMRQMRARRMVITSIHGPDAMYRGTGECQHQLARRVDRVTDVTEVTEGNTIPP